MESYDKFTDEQLIARLHAIHAEGSAAGADEAFAGARGGDEAIMDYILDKYKPLVRKRANAMFLIGGDTDDLIQEGMIGLFKAIRDYDPAHEASFFHFAELCINRQLYSAVEASNRKKHAPLNSYISLYAQSDEAGTTLADTLIAGGIDNPEELVINQEAAEQFWEKLRARLSKLERQVLDEYLAGQNYQQIAVHLGKSPKAIDNALQRIRAKVR